MSTVLISSSDTPEQIQAAMQRRQPPAAAPEATIPAPPAAPSEPPAPSGETPAASAPADASLDATPPEPAGSEPEGERLTRGQRRVRTLEGQIEDLLKRRTRLEMETERLSAQTATLQQPPPAQPQPSQLFAPTQSDGDPRPSPERFASHDEYVVALSQWGARQEWRTQEQQRQQAARQSQAEQAQQTQQQRWLAIVGQGREAHGPEFDDAFRTMRSATPPAVEQLVIGSCLESEQGAQLVHYLGTHPEELQQLQGKSPQQVLRRLGAIEAKIEGQAAPKPTPTPTPARVTPPPVTPVSGASAPQVTTTARQGETLKDYMNRRGPMKRRRY